MTTRRSFFKRFAVVIACVALAHRKETTDAEPREVSAYQMKAIMKIMEEIYTLGVDVRRFTFA